MADAMGHILSPLTRLLGVENVGLKLALMKRVAPGYRMVPLKGPFRSERN